MLNIQYRNDFLSSNVASIGFTLVKDEDSEESSCLWVCFRNNKEGSTEYHVYRYDEVPVSVYNELSHTIDTPGASVGKAVNSLVKKVEYEYDLVTTSEGRDPLRNCLLEYVAG